MLAARNPIVNDRTYCLFTMPGLPESTRAFSLQGSTSVRGTGLFTARNATLKINPAASGHGIVFRRTDLPQSPPIPALWSHVTTDPRLPGRNTTLIADPSRPASPTNATIATVEHVLSALAGLGVMDALIEIDGPEVPIGDGSAWPFVEAIDQAGLVEIPGPGSAAIVVDRVIEVPDPRTPKGASGPVVVFEPSHDSSRASHADSSGGRNPAKHVGLWMSYELDYGLGTGIAPSAVGFAIDPQTYRREIAPARTFCLEHEARALRAAGLFQHLSPNEMLVLDATGQPIDNELRFPDEPARHKLLDLIGDISLAGLPIRARVTGRRSGHALNQRAAGLIRGKYSEQSPEN